MLAGRHWLAPILANWKARIQQEDAVQEKAALAALESKIEQAMASADLQVRQEMSAAITRQAQAVRDDMMQLESRLRDDVRSQMSSLGSLGGPADGNGRAPRA